MLLIERDIRSLIREILKESEDETKGANLTPPEVPFTPSAVQSRSVETLKALQRELGVPATGIYDYETEYAWDKMVYGPDPKVRNEDVVGATTLEIATDWAKAAPKIRKVFDRSVTYTPGLRGMLQFTKHIKNAEKISSDELKSASVEEDEPIVKADCTTSSCEPKQALTMPAAETSATKDPHAGGDPWYFVESTYKPPYASEDVWRKKGDKAWRTWVGEEGKYKAAKINFHQLKDGRNNYRGAMASKYTDHTPRLFEDLKNHYGIKRIITLAADEGSKYLREHAQQAGVDVLYMPMGSNMVGRQKFDQIKEALREGNNLIHCSWGADRTGGMVARYYIEEGIMSPEEAYGDMMEYKSADKPIASIGKFVLEGPEALHP